MQTTLPDLYFSYMDIYVAPDEPKSSAKATPHRYPRTDLRNFTPWTTFEHDIHQAILSAMTQRNVAPGGVSITVGNPPRSRRVANEEDLRAQANVALHEAVEDVIQFLGLHGNFRTPGHGNTAVIGDPDYSWIEGGRDLHCKLPVREFLPLRRNLR